MSEVDENIKLYYFHLNWTFFFSTDFSIDTYVITILRAWSCSVRLVVDRPGFDSLAELDQKT